MIGSDLLDTGMLDTTAPSVEGVWKNVCEHALQTGLGRPTFAFDHPLNCFDYPTQDRLLGPLISSEFDRYCATSTQDENVDAAFHIATASSVNHKTYVQPAAVLDAAAVPLHVKEQLTIGLDNGLAHGFTLPVLDRRRKTFSVLLLHSEDANFDLREWSRLFEKPFWRYAIFLHEFLVSKLLTHSAHAPQLSPRETECLAWTMAGRSAKEIADILCLSEHTVNEYIKTASAKLGATNKTQAVARAIVAGLLTP